MGSSPVAAIAEKLVADFNFRTPIESDSSVSGSASRRAPSLIVSPPSAEVSRQHYGQMEDGAIVPLATKPLKVITRLPTPAELTASKQRDFFVVTSIDSLGQVLPPSAYNVEIPLFGDFVDTVTSLASSLARGTQGVVSDVWRGMGPTGKAGVVALGSALALRPLLAGAMRNMPLAMALRSANKGSGGVTTSRDVFEDGRIRKDGNDAFSGGSLDGGDGGLSVEIPVGFWLAMVDIGTKYDDRVQVNPWASSEPPYSGDPAAPLILSCPRIYVTSEGELVNSHLPYLAAPLAGNFLKELGSKVKKAVTNLAPTLSKIVSGAASFIPGIGPVVQPMLTRAMDAVAGLKSSTREEESRPVVRTSTQREAEFIEAMSGLTPTPVRAEAGGGSDGIAANSYFEEDDAPIEKVLGLADRSAIPPGWLPAEEMSMDEVKESFVSVLDEVQEEGTPVLGGALPALIPVAKWLAWWVGPMLLSWLLGKTKKVPPYEQTTSSTYAFKKATDNLPKDRVARMSRFKGLMTALPLYAKGIATGGKLALSIAAGAFLINLMWRGRVAAREPREAANHVLPPDLAKRLKTALETLDAEGITDPTKAKSTAAKIAAEEAESILMVAAVIARRRLADGDKDGNVKVLNKYLDGVEAELEAAKPAEREAIYQRMRYLADAVEMDAITANDYVATDIGTYLAGKEPAPTTSQEARDISANNEVNEQAVETAVAVGSEMQPDDAERVLEEAINEDPSLEAKILQLSQENLTTPKQFLIRAAAIGIPIGIAAAFLSAAAGTGALTSSTQLFTKDFWTSAWTAISGRITRVPIIPNSHELPR